MKKGFTATVFMFFMLFAFFLVIFSTQSLAVWYNDAQSVTVDLEIQSGLDIEKRAGASLDYVTADVTFIPKESESQSIIRITADPQPKISEDVYTFRWSNPVPANPRFKIDARVKTKNTFKNIRKIPFPYSGFSDEIMLYTEPAKNVDSDNPQVIAKASELATGETDYYEVVFKIADWTKETVEYDLSTLNIKATRKASWVLAKKNGVCDELTTLFMALLRSVGIPARFISGIAYTESPDFPKNWGAHGWAEIYFPGTGWVPFDVTYGQFGYVDPTHIKLNEGIDSGKSDTRYEWLGRNIDVTADTITVSADLVDHRGSVPDRIAISVDMLQKDTGIGSYNLVKATITNKVDSYVSDTIYMSRINELEVEGANHQTIMLAPKETRTFYWVVKVIDSLDSHYTYTFPMTVANARNTSADSIFYVIPGATIFSRSEMESVVEAAKKEAEKIYSKKIIVNCSQADDYYYIYDNPKIDCVVRNAGNFPFKDLEFCFEGDAGCKTAGLAIAQEKVFSDTIHYPETGINKIKFTVDGADVSRTIFYDLDVLDEPKVSIDDLEYPSQIEFQQPYTVGFTLKRESTSLPKEIDLKLDAAGLEKVVEAQDLKGDKKFLFNLDSADLSTKPNPFVISVIYEDLNGKTYTVKEEFEMTLINVTFGQKMIIFVHDLDTWLRNLFK